MTKLKKHHFLKIFIIGIAAYISVIALGFLTRFFIPNMDLPGSIIFHFLAIIIYIGVFTFLPLNSLKYFVLLAAVFFLIIYNMNPRWFPIRDDVSFDGRLDGTPHYLTPESSDYYYFALRVESEQHREKLEVLLPQNNLGPFASVKIQGDDKPVTRLRDIRLDYIKPVIIHPYDTIIMVDYLKKGRTYQIEGLLGYIENGKSPPIILVPSHINPKQHSANISLVVSDREMANEVIPVEAIPKELSPALIIYSQHWAVDSLLKVVIPNRIRDYNGLISATALSVMLCFVLIYTLGKKPIL